MNIVNDKRVNTYILYSRNNPVSPHRCETLSPSEAETLNYAYGLNVTELKWRVCPDEVVSFK